MESRVSSKINELSHQIHELLGGQHPHPGGPGGGGPGGAGGHGGGASPSAASRAIRKVVSGATSGSFRRAGTSRDAAGGKHAADGKKSMVHQMKEVLDQVSILMKPSLAGG